MTEAVRISDVAPSPNLFYDELLRWSATIVESFRALHGPLHITDQQRTIAMLLAGTLRRRKTSLPPDIVRQLEEHLTAICAVIQMSPEDLSKLVDTHR
jgi:hypothetical protein